MTFTILGTAAAEGWPALWCPCEPCAEARRRGGKDLRRRTAYHLGERIHIDLGPDSYAQMLQFGLSYASVEHLLITHSHADHLCPAELNYRSRGFVPAGLETELVIYGNSQVRAGLERAGIDLATCHARFEPLTLFEALDLGEGVVATPILADHAGPDEQAVNFVLQREGRTLLQGNDTGWWPEVTREFLAGRRLDLAILECTYGVRRGGAHHLGAEDVLEVRDELAKLGALASDTRVIVVHFSHNGRWLHEELEAFFAPEGIEVGYDGMTLEL